MELFVTIIPYSVTSNELRELFAPYKSTRLPPLDRKTSHSHV